MPLVTEENVTYAVPADVLLVIPTLMALVAVVTVPTTAVAGKLVRLAPLPLNVVAANTPVLGLCVNVLAVKLAVLPVLIPDNIG